jgi:very-short-patch-repair endonuclease
MSTEIEKFLKQCQKNLIDTSGRNNLINFKFNAKTCLDLDRVRQQKNTKINKDQSFEISKIENFNDEDLSEQEKLQLETYKILGKIYLKQKEIKDEKGFNATNWAYYFFKYVDGDGERFAPIFLISADVEKDGRGKYRVNNPSQDQLDIKFNFAIYEKFKNDFEIEIDKEITEFDNEDFDISDIEERIAKLKEFLKGNLQKISIEERVFLGIFNSAKASLYHELVGLEDKFINHQLIQKFYSNETDNLKQDPREIDELPSHNFFSPFDFDSSQLQAIKAAKDGQNFIIQGPPGTGKTQTISNIIAELVAEGKNVLFVAEKKAAIDAVLKNFSKIGLKEIFLDLHDKKSKSRDIIDSIVNSIDFFQYENIKNRPENFLLELDETKKELTRRSDLIHSKLSFGKKPFDLIFELMELNRIGQLPKIECNFFIDLSQENFEKSLQALSKIKDFHSIYSDVSNPFLDKNLDQLKSFLELERGKKLLTKLKNLILELKKTSLNIQDLKKTIQNFINKANDNYFDIQKFKNKNDLESVLAMFEIILANKDLLENKNNPWLKDSVKKLEKFDVDSAKKDLEELLLLLIKKSKMEIEENSVKSAIYDIKNNSINLDEIKLFNQQQAWKFDTINNQQLKNNFSFSIILATLKILIEFLDKLENYKNIIYGSGKMWIDINFKEQCFSNANFINDLEKILGKFLENDKIFSDLNSELNYKIKNNITTSGFINFIKFYFRRNKARINSSKVSNKIIFCKKWIKIHLEGVDEKIENISLVKEMKDFIYQNKNILDFKKLQQNIYKNGFKDFFLNCVKNESDFTQEKEVLKKIYSKISELENIKSSIKNLSGEIIIFTKKINDYLFEISPQEKDLKDKISSRIEFINEVEKIIFIKNLKEDLETKVELYKIKELWSNLECNKIELNSIKLISENYFFNKSNLIEIEEKSSKIKHEIEEMEILIFDLLESKKDSEKDLLLLENKVDFYTKYLPILDSSIRYLDLIEDLEGLSIKDFWYKFIESESSPSEVVKIFKKTFYLKVLENLKTTNSLFANTAEASRIIEDFKNLDKNSIRFNKERIILKLKSKNKEIVNSQEFRRLKSLQRFPKPRKIITKYRDVIINAVGCVVCSPLTICEYFEVNKNFLEPMFDAVIFDEASQIYTWDALSSILRAKQMIIAGDTEQMPPTNLFVANDDNGDVNESEIEDVGDFKSLLSFGARNLKELSLQWHYRSKFEQLIQPSNQFVYNGRLITFPNSDKQQKPIVYHYLPEGIWNQTNEVEARFVIKLLREIYQNGDRSVGVVAINQKQQNLILDLIDMDSEIRSWLDSEEDDGLFVKNLENCQGDERDIIVICSSYAKNKDGKIDGRMFGQIGKDDSYKRLNVMFSRAKNKLHFLSSLEGDQIPDHLVGEKKGMKFFKNYLYFAKTGKFGNSAGSKNQDDFDSGFEESVCKSLRLLGYEVDSQVGCSGYKIDLAIVCPKSKNYILGIECDGEMYHSGRTARERDRLRQDVLESKGWKIHRIWSYDWLDSKKEEIEKLKNKIESLMN